VKGKLIDFIEKQKKEKKKAEDDAKKNKLPSFELQDRQTASDLMSRPTGRTCSSPSPSVRPA
jgi:hypothetical protein